MSIDFIGMDQNAIKLSNFKKLMAIRGMTKEAIAERYGCDPRHIGNILEGRSGIGSKAITKLADILGVDEKEFYRWDQSVDTDAIPVDIAQAMTDVKNILLLARQLDDDWYTRIVLGTINTYKEGIKRNMERRELIERLKRIESKLGITSETPPAARPPARKKVSNE